MHRRRVRSLGTDVLQQAALRKLRMLDAATSVDGLRVPPGNRLERLRGDRAGQYSIRVNRQWRICFGWNAGDAHDVEIVHYHSLVRRAAMATDLLPPVHPGEVLLEEFLAPLDLSQYRLANDISVPPPRINEIVHGKRAITADTALRLARYFATSARFWLNLQASTTWTFRAPSWAIDSNAKSFGALGSTRRRWTPPLHGGAAHPTNLTGAGATDGLPGVGQPVLPEVTPAVATIA